MVANYFMTEEFDPHATKAVAEAITKADELGLPKAYDNREDLPKVPVVQSALLKRKHAPDLPPKE